MSGGTPFDAEVDAIFESIDGTTPPGQSLSVTLAALAKLNEEPVVVQFFNRPIGPIAGGFSIDPDAGIVTFTHPVGHLENPGIEAPEMGVMRPNPHVRFTFAYEDGPLPREGAIALGARLPPDAKGQGAARYHYHALFARTKDGKVQQITADLVDPDLGEEARYPLVVKDETLRLVYPLEGASNRADLDRRAREIAEALLNGDQEVSGEDGEAYALLPMDPSSVIGRVSWEGDADGCRTSWTIGISKAAKAKTLAARIAAEAQPKATGGRQ